MCQTEFQARSQKPAGQLELYPGKEVFSALNRRLQTSGYKAVSVKGVAANLAEADVLDEVTAIVQDIEALAVDR